ncbi:hypothetical protein, partial [Flavobacterium sp.]|uniref:hypothetical protein n=1 Tax=Flavobacterium sp. TaxID=239 RepID=UPI0037BEC97A
KPLISSNGGGDTASVTVSENSTAVTRLVATSLNANATLVYSIAGGADAALFQIHPATGELNFKNAPDFETPADLGANNVYDVIVQVSDGTSTDTQEIQVVLQDVADNDNVYRWTGLEFAISQWNLTDLIGNDQILAENLSLVPGPQYYVTSAIHQSNLWLGDGTIDLRALTNHGYYASGISGGGLTMGSGNSSLVVEAIEQSPSSFFYQVSGINGWMLDAGAGNDNLAIKVRSSKSETFSDYGIVASNLAFGEGTDTLIVDVVNNSGVSTSRGIETSTISLGAGSDNVQIISTGYGITGSSMDAGAGNDTLTVQSALNAVGSSSILMGSGSDTVTLASDNVNSAELVNSLIDLGTDDDVIIIGRSVNSTIIGGEGTDTLYLAGTLFDYQFSALPDRILITRPDDGNFSLTVQGVEDIRAEGTIPAKVYSAEHLTGFLSDPYGLDTLYMGTGLSAAIENLTVVDAAGDDIVRAVNSSITGGFSSYLSNGILGSNFTFGDGTITFQSKINQGYYATAVNGGSLNMGDGNSFIDIQAVEDFPADRLGFYYGVTGIAGWQLKAGGGDDTLNLTVRAQKTETFNSLGIYSGSYDFGEGNDIADISVINISGTGEAVAIASVSSLTFGSGNDKLKVLSTGMGVTGSLVDTGTGNDIIDISVNRDAIHSSQISVGADNDLVFFKRNGANSTDLFNSSVDLGDGDDYADFAFAVNSTIDGGQGYDILRLRGDESSYVVKQNSDGVYHITQTDNALFSLTARNFESLIFGGVAARPVYSGSPLTGYLTGSAQGDDVYVGKGLSAAIENLTVVDTKGFNRVEATNRSLSGGIESYSSHAIINSDFTFDGLGLDFAAQINQGYYARAVSG